MKLLSRFLVLVALADTGTPMDDNDYQVPFRFTGKLDKLTLTIDRPRLTPEDGIGRADPHIPTKFTGSVKTC